MGDSMPTVPLVFARQPIFDTQGRVYGYEMLHRAVGKDSASFRIADAATATVSVHAVLDVGLDVLTGGALAFFNLTRPILTERLYEFLPAGRVVLEVLEDVEVDPDLVREIERAKSRGYRIALDDFVLWGSTAELAPLADVIKVEVPLLDEAELRRHARALARPDVLLLAEKVETHEVQRCCVDAGYELFQGYFFKRPELVEGKHVPPNRALTLSLLARLQDPATTIEDIERLIAANTALSYKLLRYVNSALHGVLQPIESIRHAIVMLGLDRVRTCSTMLLLAGLEDKPHELIVTALVRARHCQLLGGARNEVDPQKLFTVGLLSLLDAFLDQPMNELLAGLPVAPDIHAALLNRTGPLAATLDVAISLERMDVQSVSMNELEPQFVCSSYLEALVWANEIDAVIRTDSAIARAAPPQPAAR
jgi:EAL and modified HD-GYP domain-containing signal transduction protein